MFHGVTGCYSGGFRNRGPGGRPPLIFSPDLDQRGGKICFLETAPPPPTLSQGLDPSACYMVLQRVTWYYTVLKDATRWHMVLHGDT